MDFFIEAPAPGGGNGGGGGGGGTPPTIIPCTNSYTKIINGKRVTVNEDGTCTVVHPLDSLPKDPCEQRAILNGTSNAFWGQYSDIRTRMLTLYNSSSSAEWGVDIKNRSLLSVDYINEAVSEGVEDEVTHLKNQWAEDFTWDSTFGYTLGTIHGHMEAGPYLTDVQSLLSNIPKILSLGGGLSGVEYYKSHATMSVIEATTDKNYTVTVKNWEKLDSIFQNNPIDSLNKRFKQKYDNTNKTSEIAILSIFGDAINLFMDEDNTHHFKPIFYQKTVEGYESYNDVDCDQ